MANNMSGRFDLCALKSVIEKKKNKAGQEVDCIVIPLAANHLELATDSKGKYHVNLDWSAWPRKTPSQFENDKSTHIVNQDPGKEIRDALKSETPARYPATLGNMVAWDQVTGGTPEPESNAAGMIGEGDDIPF